jgi:hypothetical protein
LGINAKSKTVRKVKTVMECPEGKLECPGKAFPMITKLLWSKVAAGLGTENQFFNPVENINENKDAKMRASHILGAGTMKILRIDRKINASPSCVKL